MSKVLLISEAQLKNESILEKNVDSKVLSKIILTVQDTQLKSILGTTVYEALIEEVYSASTSGTTMSPASKILLNEYIQPFLIQACVVDFITVNNYRLSNKGVLKLNDNSASGVSAVELEAARTFYANYKQVYETALKKYLSNDSCSSPDINFGSTGWYLN